MGHNTSVSNDSLADVPIAGAQKSNGNLHSSVEMYRSVPMAIEALLRNQETQQGWGIYRAVTGKKTHL